MRQGIQVGIVVLVLVLVSTAQAAVTVDYLGSFKLGTAAGYYGNSLALLPDGFAREAGDAVRGPTLLTVGGHPDGDNVVEWTIPTLSKTPGGLQTAVVVPASANGTNVVDVYSRYGSGFESMTVFNGRVWAQHNGAQNNFATQLVAFGAGINETWTSGNGGTSSVYGFATNLPNDSINGSHTGFGIVPKKDEANVMLTLRFSSGTKVNQVLRATWDTGTGAFGDASKVFDFSSDVTQPRSNLEYINIGGQWYYATAVEQVQALSLWLFNAAASGSNVTPDYIFPLSGTIAGGAGWYHTGSQIQDLVWDGQNGILYALDTATYGGGKGGLVHAFAFVPEPTTLALLVLGGLAMGRRRR